LSDPISTTITCRFSSSIDTSAQLEIGEGATFSGTTSSGNLADAMVASLSSNGEARTSFIIGESVEVSISEPGAFAAAGAEARIKECTVYENIEQLTNPISLLKSSSCGMNILNAAATDEFNFSFRNGSRVEFLMILRISPIRVFNVELQKSAFQYSSTSNESFSIKCSYQICIVDENGDPTLSSCFDDVAAAKSAAEADSALFTCS
jgi:hypothetical protein